MVTRQVLLTVSDGLFSESDNGSPRISVNSCHEVNLLSVVGCFVMSITLLCGVDREVQYVVLMNIASMSVKRSVS